LNFRQDFKAGLEAQRLAVVHVEVGDAGLRNRDQALLFGLAPEKFGDQSLGDIALEAFAKALFDDGGGHVPGAEAGQAGAFLVALNLEIGFAGDVGGWNLDRNLALGIFLIGFWLYGVGGFCGLTFYLSVRARIQVGLLGANGAGVNLLALV